MPRFVILEHDHPTLHWDLLLDNGVSLRSWRLGAAPRPGVTTTCLSIPDHRQAYLDYEGPVSGNRGSVKRVLAGTYSVVNETQAYFRIALAPPGPGLEIVLSPPSGEGTASIRAC